MRRWSYGLLVLFSAVLIAVAGFRMGRSHPTKRSPTTAAPHAQPREEKAASEPPRLFVLAINGGGSVRGNYLSHLQHLRELVDLLHGAGVPWDRVTVLAGDGNDPNPDLIVRMASLGADAWRLRGTAVEEYFPSETILGNSEVSGATLQDLWQVQVRGATACFRQGGARVDFGHHGRRRAQLGPLLREVPGIARVDRP